MTSALVRVGALALLVGVLAIVAGLYMGGVWGRLGTYEIYVRMDNAGGVESGSDVMMSGVRIGTVVATKLSPDEKNWPGRPVRITLAIRKEILIPASYEFCIDQGGLLATRHIAVEPPKRKGAAFAESPAGVEKTLTPGCEVAGKGLAGLAALGEIASQAGDVVPKLTSTVEEKLDRLATRAEATYLSERQEQLVHQVMVNISQMTATANRAARQVERIAATIQRAAEKGSPEAVAMVKELRQAATNVRQAAEHISRMVAVTPVPVDLAGATAHIRRAAAAVEESAIAVRDITGSAETQLRIREFTANLARVSAAMAGLSEEAEKFVSDPQLQADLRQSIADLQETTTSMKTTAKHLEELLTDPQMSDDLRATVHHLRGLTATGEEVAAQASRSLERVDRTMESLSRTVRAIRPEQVTGQVDLWAINDQGGRLDLDLNLRYRSRHPGYWRLGVVDLGDSERFNFQRAFGLGEAWTLRGGVFANKAGIGIDWNPSGKWWSEVELYDPKEGLLDLTLYRSLSNGWQLGLGVSDVFDRADAFVGVRRAFELSGSPERDEPLQ